jgi:hypothetical protein
MSWGEEAFARARAEDKPLLISIGYASCHWCHVMERESFADPRIAERMNRELVCVKVDREERPDVDRVYLNAVAALSGQGGWPLNCFATPEGHPFYGGTYFPPEASYGRPAWVQLVEAVGSAWRDPEQRARVLKDAETLTSALRGLARPAFSAENLDAQALDSCLAQLRGSFDPEEGGFSRAPKFPMPANQHLLLRLSARLQGQGRLKESAEALRLATETLRAAARGGIHDQLGGGFCRYSVDSRWHLPHFEKMLYDNAQLALNYLEAYQATGDAFLAGVAEGIFTYVLRDLASPEGAFYASEDADSLPAPGAPEAKEGAFYVWTRSEIDAVLGPEADRFCSAYGVDSGGNVREDPQGEFRGRNVLRDLRGTLAAMAGAAGASEAEQEERLAASRSKLFEARAARPRPRRDEKVLASWNGLMIAALAKGARVLGRRELALAADRCADFLLKNLWSPSEGILKRRWAAGAIGIEGQAEDYAFLAWGLLELHQTGFEEKRLEACEALLKAARLRFYDEQDGLVFAGGRQGDPLLPARIKESQDNVEPAPASVLAELGLRLWALGRPGTWREDAERTLKGHAGQMASAPRSLPFMAAVLDRALAPPQRLVVAGEAGDPRTFALLEAGRTLWLPHLERLRVDPGAPLPDGSGGFGLVEGTPAAYLCRDFACGLPMTDPKALETALARLQGK